MKMTEWYSFNPQDTLYFRGAEPADMGESHAASMVFPPPVHTIAGALRTAVLVQQGVSFDDYNRGTCNPEISEKIGKSGSDPPFGIIGPFFLFEGRAWVPCPFTWFAEKNGKGLRDNGTREIVISQPSPSRFVKSPAGDKLFWVKGKNLETLGGQWTPLDELCNGNNNKWIKSSGDFFVYEPHTGIALDVKDQRRAIREGHLYSFQHARLCEGVVLGFGCTRELGLAESGVLKFGAEQRFGEYKKIQGLHIPAGKSGLYMALSIVAGDEETNGHCVATGKIRYLGGWDLHRKFHKPMVGYFPPGSVFDKKINDYCIEL